MNTDELDGLADRQKTWEFRSRLFEKKIKELARFITDLEIVDRHLYRYLYGQLRHGMDGLPIEENQRDHPAFDFGGQQYDLGNARKELTYIKDEIDAILNGTSYASSIKQTEAEYFVKIPVKSL